MPKCCVGTSPFPKQQISDSSKLKELAYNNFKVDENSRKFLQWVENTVGKAEIARYEQILLFPPAFSAIFVMQTHKKQDLFGKGLE